MGQPIITIKQAVSILLLILFMAGPGHGADLLGGRPWALVGPPDAVTLQSMPVDDIPGGNTTALRVTILRPIRPFWGTELSQVVHASVPANDRLRLVFWARSATNNPIRAVLEKATAPYDGVLQIAPMLTPQWQHFVLVGTLAAAYGPDGLGLRFQLGQQAGTVELAGIALKDLGTDPAIAIAQAAVSPAAEQSRIRHYRMADLTVMVCDSRGRPIPGVRVHVQMLRHAFLFGCNFFGFDPDDDSPLQAAYRSQFAGLFNYATLPFYWGAFEPRPGQPDYPRLDAMANWCITHGITPKAHPLVWHQVWPAWAPKDADASIPLLHRRVSDIVTHYGGLIHYYDVVNEANSPDASTGEGAWIQRDGAATVVGTALGWARAAGQGEGDTFLYNDFNTGDSNVSLLDRLRQGHHLPDAIGIQSHMHGGVWPLTHVWLTCQRFAQFGLPIHFTETTVLSGPWRDHDPSGPPATDWVTTSEGEAAQSAYVTQFYTLLFSHPSVRAITWWDFSDLNAWQGAPAGLVRKDMTPKPAYTVLMTLIHKTWWTNAEGRTDKTGRYALRAFYGDYRISVTDTHGNTVTQTLTWPEASGPHRTVVLL